MKIQKRNQMNTNNERASGILLHPSSLPGSYGIGTLGTEAFRFIDFLEKSKQKYWQILPLGPTGYGDSPYQCFSSFAGNPLLINLESLEEEGLLTIADMAMMQSLDGGPVDYGNLVKLKIPVLRNAALHFLENKNPKIADEFGVFYEDNKAWLGDYSLFMSLKGKFDLQPWQHWNNDIRMRVPEAVEKYRSELKDEIFIQQFIQFLFFRQWQQVKKYANSKNIKIIGDIPLYIAMDSADAWTNPELFDFDEDRNPVTVGGVPPDYFSATGQLWGNPIFRWETHKKTGYCWWVNRMRGNLKLYDVIRIDHFRGFAAFWAVPYHDTTAINGKWVNGPGADLFKTIRKQLGNIPIIAEDLGVITRDVEELRDSLDFPGMKILQFAFDANGANEYLPHNYPKNCVVYTGTHDNDTMLGWYQKSSPEDKAYILEYLQTDGSDICFDFIRLALSSVANTAIIPMQDLLCENSVSRMNVPGTTMNNWMWRMKPGQANDEIAEKLAYLAHLYGRANKS
ncbi:MAG: 4-alpha-glucanotransferase [Syntrophothermus sp.]